MKTENPDKSESFEIFYLRGSQTKIREDNGLHGVTLGTLGEGIKTQ